MADGVRSVKNQYRGINAHLHSLLQAESRWGGFHTAHIADLNKTLKAGLLPMGYTTDIEPSLQIRRLGEPPAMPRSDVSIFDRDLRRASQPPVPLQAQAPVLTLPIPTLLQEYPLSEKPFRAIAVYEINQHDKPVAWLELLSPSNKGDSRDAELYRKKRLKIIGNGIVLIELDYLHETPPTFEGLPDYDVRQGANDTPDSHPYRIVIIDPRPDVETGQAFLAAFDIDQPIPPMTIPLNAGDVFPFDFGVPYTKTYEEMLYGVELVDYSQLPLNFDRYSPDDQARIAARMLAVIEAAKRGENLETGRPFPVTLLPLDEALAQLAV